MAASIKATDCWGTWTDYYSRNRRDGGSIEAMFDSNMRTLSLKSASHLNDVDKLTQTIVESANFNMLIVPGEVGNMQLLHHGFACGSGEGLALAFVNGNIETATFKTFSRIQAVEPITGAFGRRKSGNSSACPSLRSMFAVQSAEEFRELQSEGNHVLDNYPNHHLISAEIFLIAKGAKSISAKELAYTLIKKHKISYNDSKGLRGIKESEAEWFESLLAMLWASENALLKPIFLEDVAETLVMNTMIRNVKEKLTRAAATTAQSAVGRLDEILQDHITIMGMLAMRSLGPAGSDPEEEEESKLETMLPIQNTLFTDLSTADMDDPPEISEFVRSLAKSTTRQQATNLLREETRDWDGTYSVDGFHKFFSDGFLSQKNNPMEPGGFSIFMFHPKGVELGDGNLKDGYFSPKTAYDLRIQLQTALNMLELMTCNGSIATKGLSYVLEPRRWASIVNMLTARFESEPGFGAKFCFAMDRPLQIFFKKVLLWDDICTQGERQYLLDKAKDLLERIELGQEINVILPPTIQSLVTLSGAALKRDATVLETKSQDERGKRLRLQY